MTANGEPTQAMLAALEISALTLNLWRRRYRDCGIEDLKQGKTRHSRVPPLPVEKVQEVLRLTLTRKPAAATHWSCRTLAQQICISRNKTIGDRPRFPRKGKRGQFLTLHLRPYVLLFCIRRVFPSQVVDGVALGAEAIEHSAHENPLGQKERARKNCS